MQHSLHHCIQMLEEVIFLIFNWNVRLNIVKLICIFIDYEKAVEILINNGADLSAQNSKGVTALHLAAINGRVNLNNWLWINNWKSNWYF